METVPYIDIVEPERIAALLADPRNFAWRAVDSETLDTWIPDLGLTSYPHPSIYRPPGTAQSDTPSTLRHRFWGTVEHQYDHTGWRYIGVLLYAAAGEPCPLEVRLASDAIGRAEPHRLDNRRHLIVLDKTVRFIGEMEVFQLTAPGPGTYRIEHFVLLSERPRPSRFVPQIDRLTTATQRQANGLFQADFHFITSELAVVHVQLQSGDQVTHGDQPATYHHLTLSDLPAETAWTAKITATDRDGETDVQTATFQTTTPAGMPAVALSIPVELMKPGTGDFTSLPLTFGMPLTEGILFEPPSLQLETPQAALPVQTCVHARWPDQSARWMLVDTQIPPDLAQTRTIQAHIRPRSQTLNTVPRLTHHFNSNICQVTSDQLRVTVATNASVLIEQRYDDQWHVRLSAINLEAVLGSGLALKPGPTEAVTLEEAGDYRAVIRFTVPLRDAAGTTYLLSALRLTVYAGQSFIRLVHRLGVVSPCLNDDPDEASTLLPLRTLAVTLPGLKSEVVHALDSSWLLTNDASWKLQQDHDRAYTLTHNGVKTIYKGRVAGHIKAVGPTGAFGIAIKRFWQTYPKALQITTEGVQVELFPELSEAPMPGDEDAWHRLYFWLRDGVYLLKAGMNLTSEVLLDFDGTDAAVFHWLEQPVLARPDIDYLNATGALNPIAPKTGSRLPAYETLVDEALASFHADREAWRAYGHVNFGDWYGESGWSWGNNEYDTAYCAYTEFLRGGDPDWATLGADAVRHLVDVDTLNFAADSSAIGGQAMHMPGHLGGYLPPLFRSKVGGTKSIPSHTWIEGPLLHYLLTGDESVRETIEKTKRWLLDQHWFDYYDFSNCRESGWHIIHLCMLARATGDPNCLNAAAIIVRRVLEREAPGGGWVRMLTESHCGCGYPRCQGEAGFMVGVLLSGLKRYYNLTGDERVAQAINGGARWLIRHTYDTKSGHFRYTSCANRTLGGGYQQTQWVLEGLADAYEISGDSEIGRYVHQGLNAIGHFPEGLGHSGLGKALAQQMRYVPTLLHALQKRPL